MKHAFDTDGYHVTHSRIDEKYSKNHEPISILKQFEVYMKKNDAKSRTTNSNTLAQSWNSLDANRKILCERKSNKSNLTHVKKMNIYQHSFLAINKADGRSSRYKLVKCTDSIGNL